MKKIETFVCSKCQKEFTKDHKTYEILYNGRYQHVCRNCMLDTFQNTISFREAWKYNESVDECRVCHIYDTKDELIEYLNTFVKDGYTLAIQNVAGVRCYPITLLHNGIENKRFGFVSVWLDNLFHN